MKYRLQRVELKAFLRDQAPLHLLSPDLRQRLRHALARGGELSVVGPAAIRELIRAGAFEPRGRMVRDGRAIPLYGLPGSARAYDLEAFLDGGEARRPTPARAATPAPASSPATGSQVVRAIRATLRRDWVSHGIEPALQALLVQLGLALGEARPHLLLFAERLGQPLAEGEGWELLWEGDARTLQWLRRLNRAPEDGLLQEGRRWVPLRDHLRLKGALGVDPGVDGPLAREAAGALGDLLAAHVRSQSRVNTDALTGLHNRGYFDHQLGVEIERSRRSHGPLAMLFADLDHFKRVNDAHGHEVGDEVLRHVAALFVRHLRRIDYVFRWGGEEFALLLPGADVEEAQLTAERLRKTVAREPVRLRDGRQLDITLSVGVAVFPDHADGRGELVRRADQALYAAKAAGRDCVRVAGDGN